MSKKTPILVLSKELFKVGGRIFADFMARNSTNNEVKKSIEASDFLTGILAGKIKKEWKLEESEDYLRLMELNKAIKILNNHDQ